MSILIRGMEMPYSCYDCPLTNDGFYLCKGVKPYKQLETECEERKPNWCPLVHVPAYGRLINADALMNLIREHSYPLTAHFNSTDNGLFTIGIQQAVDETPTIIEAEGEP